ncbi:twin-arginine translocation signal domain-containing protein [Phenylobacterium sp.]|uniref:twin-arginine translocation signal domain-containing protein n=1 Tax=Phenylobacterium sp. TaxID=1871053 RepID=UPI002F3F7E4A
MQSGAGLPGGRPAGGSRRDFLVHSACVAAAGSANAAAPTPPEPAPPLVFVSNVLADYLQLLMFRLRRDTFAPFDPPGFAQAPSLDELVAAPEAVASAGLTRYDQLHGFIATAFAGLPAKRVTSPRPRILCYSDNPPSLEAVQAVVAAGAPFFPAFETYWRQSVQPLVQAQIAGWREQDAAFHPLRKVIELQRMPLRAPRLEVVAMPFHPSGSGNYSPPAIFSSLFERPNLPWFLGHEASHLIWSEALGRPLSARPEAARVTALATANRVDVEETMCLFMQAEVSKRCGLSKPDLRMSTKLEAGPQKRLMIALEDGWDDYLADPRRWPDLQAYVLAKASAVLGQG